MLPKGQQSVVSSIWRGTFPSDRDEKVDLKFFWCQKWVRAMQWTMDDDAMDFESIEKEWNEKSDEALSFEALAMSWQAMNDAWSMKMK